MSNRQQITFISAVLMLSIATLSLIAIAQTAPSVPNLIAYQGRVTLAGGSPVTDGVYPATFTIYGFSLGGSALWTENASVTTNGGAFSHNLGGVSALPATLATTNDSLWLAIVFNGELLSPRTRIVGNAFSLTANQLEMSNGSGVVALRTNPANHQLSQYGSDGSEHVRLWGSGWPQLLMDANSVNGATDDLELSTNGGDGSLIRIRKPTGQNGISLYSGTTSFSSSFSMTNTAGTAVVAILPETPGDDGVVLPGNAVSALEIFDEAGIASFVDSPYVAISGPFTNVASRSITVPNAGYVVALASMYARLESGSGALEAAISTNPASFVSPSYYQSGHTGDIQKTVTIHEVISVAPGAHTFYLQTNPFSGTWRIHTMSLTLMYFPTSYGTVTASQLASDDNSAHRIQWSREQLDAEIAHRKRLENEVVRLREQAEKTTRKLAELEENMSESRANAAIVDPKF